MYHQGHTRGPGHNHEYGTKKGVLLQSNKETTGNTYRHQRQAGRQAQERLHQTTDGAELP
jgi:hypothetical protein